MNVSVLNPLGGGLGHYTEALAHTLQAAGARTTVTTVSEPIVTGYSRSRWLAGYARSVVASRASRGDLVIATWPAVGYWDYLLLRLAGGVRTPVIIMHDPVPLVYARGYGRLPRRLAASRPVSAKAIVHTSAAAATLSSTFTGGIAVLPLPMLRPARGIPSRDDTPIIRVVGQYKQSRDLDALRSLRKDGPPNWRYEIVGRGWPHLQGWHVQDRFLPEAEFVAALRTADVVLIPYKSFFQSGVALQCLEAGVPFVGPRKSHLSSLVPSHPEWLTDGSDDWVAAVEGALATPRAALHDTARTVYANTVSAWRDWLANPEFVGAGVRSFRPPAH
jgi:hypothetical protein